MRFDNKDAPMGVTIIAENQEEKALLNSVVVLLELMYPSESDTIRPTPWLLLLETLQIHAHRMARERREADARAGDTHRNRAQPEREPQQKET